MRALAALPREVRAEALEDAQQVIQRGLRVVQACLEGTDPSLVRDRDYATRVTLGCELLDSIARLGVRVPEIDPGVQVLDCLLGMVMLQELDWGVYWTAQLNAIQLDLPSFHNYFKPQGSASPKARERPWSEESRNPWQRFLDLRVACMQNPKDPASIPELRACLLDPERFAQGEPWSLGPRQWAGAAGYLADHSPANDADLELLERAATRDPGNPRVYRSLATWFRRRERLPEARDAIARGIAEFDRTYGRNVYRRWTLTKMLQDEVRIRAALDDRTGSRESWRRLSAVGPDTAHALEKELPWLRED